MFLASADEFDEDPNAALNAAEDEGTGKKGKKGKKSKKSKTGEHLSAGEKKEAQVWPYHAEDDFITKVSLAPSLGKSTLTRFHLAQLSDHRVVFPYTLTPKKDEGGDSFGVETRGSMMLVPGAKFSTLVEGLEGFLGGSD